MYEANISKEEVNELPIEEFDGPIVVVDSEKMIEKAFKELSKEKIVGIDTETRPSFKRGVIHKVSLVQIATTNTCYLFRLNKIGFPKELTSFLANIKVKKIGLSLKDDIHSLNRHKKLKVSNIVDLQIIAKEYGILELSLQKIYAIVFGKKISKSQRLTNWENPTLTDKQKIYASTDAWSTLMIYNQFTNSEKVNRLQD